MISGYNGLQTEVAEDPKSLKAGVGQSASEKEEVKSSDTMEVTSSRKKSLPDAAAPVVYLCVALSSAA